MKIHRVIESHKDEWEAHPDLGLVKVRRTVMQPSDDAAIVHDGKQYSVSEDGSFDVPPEVGAFYVGRLGWHTGPSPFAVETPTKPQRRTAEV